MAGPVTEAVADTSVLIGLHAAGALASLDLLFETIFVPQAVWTELAAAHGTAESKAVGELRSVRLVPDRALSLASPATLGAGELQVIAHASAARCLALLDDHAARQQAKSLGLQVRGVLGLLVEARRRGHSTSVKPAIARLLAAGFRLDHELIRRTLEAVDETWP